MQNAERLIFTLQDPAFLSQVGAYYPTTAPHEIVDELLEMGDHGALERVVKSLSDVLAGDGSSRLKEGAVICLGQLKQPRALEALTSALNDPSLRCDFTVWALGEIGDPRAADHLLRYLEHGLHRGNGEVHEDVVDVIVQLGDKRIVPHLVAELCRPDEYSQYHAALHLGTIGDRSALPELDRLAATHVNVRKDVDVKTAAAEAGLQIRARVT
jgi:HEAT repeat protein